MQMRQTTATKAPAIAQAITISTYQSVPVVGIGTYTPTTYSQRELMAKLGLQGNAFAESIASNAGIDARSFSIAPDALTKMTSLDDLAAHHRKQAPRLAARAIEAAAGTTIDLSSLDAVITATSTGFMLPGIAEVLCETYGIGRRGALRYDLVGQGCIAAIPALQIARALIASQQARRVAVVCSEPQAALYNPQAEGKTTIVQQLIFGEGAGALILDGESTGDGTLPSFIDSEQEQATDSLEAVSIKQGNVWESMLDRAVPDIAGRLLPGVIQRLLNRHGLRSDHVKHWAFHTGGRRVLEVCQEGLGLSDEQMAPSYEVLRNHGNMSSPSVIFSLQKLIATHAPKPGDIGIMVSVGPGMMVGAYLVRWQTP